MEKAKIKIMVVGGNGGGVGEGILKSLRLAGYHDVTLLEHHTFSAHLYRVSQKVIIKENPDKNCRVYIDKVLDYCCQQNIKVVIPGSNWECLAYASKASRFEELGILLLCNNIEVIKICNDKWQTYNFLNAHDLGTPRTFQDNEVNLLEEPFPVVLKPRIGRGSEDTFVLSNVEEYQALKCFFDARHKEFIVQEYLGREDEEYTVGVLSDCKGQVIDSIVMQRYLAGGYTNHARVSKRSYINDFCEKIANTLNSTGPINMQLRLNEKGQPMVFEINPRFSGSAPMRSLAGFNEVDLSIRWRLLNEKPEPVNYKDNYEFFRTFQELIVDRNHPEKPATTELLI